MSLVYDLIMITCADWQLNVVYLYLHAYPFYDNYLRQGGNVFAGFCLFVCSFDC